jgi:hypothetical protein
MAAWLGWTLDVFDFTVFLLVMLPISQEFGPPLTAVPALARRGVDQGNLVLAIVDLLNTNGPGRDTRSTSVDLAEPTSHVAIPQFWRHSQTCNAYIHVAGDRQPVLSHEPPRRPLTAETWCLGIGGQQEFSPACGLLASQNSRALKGVDRLTPAAPDGLPSRPHRAAR